VSSTPPATIDALVLKRAGILTVVAGAIITIISAILAGSAGVIGAIFATVVVVIFFSAGQLTLGKVLRTNPELAMSVALVIYLAKIGILFVLIILFADTTLFNTKVFAITVVICTLVWTAAEVWIFARTKVLYVDPGAGK
jgi:ATP synthase protein I